MKTPPRWTPDELDADRQEAIELFRKERLEEPVAGVEPAASSMASWRSSN